MKLYLWVIASLFAANFGGQRIFDKTYTAATLITPHFSILPILIDYSAFIAPASGHLPLAPVVIDQFTTNQATLSDPPGGASSVAGAGMLGGTRDLSVDLFTGAGPATTEVSGGSLAFIVTATTPDSRGEAAVSWDGDTDPITLSPTGLGGVDLTVGGCNALRLTVTSATAGTEVTVDVYTDGANASRGSLILPAVGAATNFHFLFPTQLFPLMGSGADFSDVGAIVLTVRGTEKSCSISQFEAVKADPAVTAAQTDEILMDGGAIGTAEPGEKIRYKVTVGNANGDGPATGVQLSVTPDALTTFVGGSFRTSPVAVADNYACTGNVGISVPAGSGLKANDFDDDLAGATISNGTFATTQGGSITIAADGSFSYTPPVNFTGADTYDYTLNDGNDVDMGGPIPGTDVGTVTITVSNLIWFIDNSSVAGTEDGRLNTPFKSIANFSASALPAAGQVIFLKNTGTEYRGGFILKNNQLLFGSGHSGGTNLADAGVLPFTVATNSFTLPAIGGTRPLIKNMGMGSSANQTGIVLASGNTIRGVEVGRCGVVKISGTNFGTLTIGNTTTPDVALSGNVHTLNLNMGAFAATSKFASINSPDSSSLILNNVSGSLGSASTTITALGSGGSITINIQNSSAALDFGNTTVNNNNGQTCISISSSGTGSVTFSNLSMTSASNGTGLLASTGGTINIGGTSSAITARMALDITNTSFGAGATFASITSSNFSGKAVNLDNVSGSLTINGGSIATNAAIPAGNAFDVNAGSSNITYAGSISYTGVSTNRVVEVTGRTGGTVTFSGTINATSGTGINVASNTVGTIDFSGNSKTLSTGTNTAVTLATNTGSTINFTNGGLAITTTSGTGFNATGGGTVTVQGSTNTINSTTGTALNVVSTTIGASNLTFQSISANGGTNGIVLNSTGSSGGLTVTGTGSAGSGGTIQNCTSNGISLTSTRNIFLSFMNMTGNDDNGISGSTIHGFKLDNCSIQNNGDNAATDDCGINLTELTGTAIAGTNPTSITNCTISNNWEFEIQIINNSGTLTDLQMSGNTISSNGFQPNHGNLVTFQAYGTAVMKLTVTSGNFTGNTDTSGGKIVTATAVHADASSNGSNITVNISGATFTNNNVATTVSTSLGGIATFNISNNTATGNRSVGLNVFASGNGPFTGAINGKFEQNTVGTFGVANSGSNLGSALRIQNEGAVPVNILINNNTLQEVTSFQGITVNVGLGGFATGGQPTNLTITNNTIREIDGSRAIAIQDNQTTAPNFPTICVNMSGNIMSNVFGQAGDGTFVRLRRLNGTFNVTQASLAALEAANTCDGGSCSGLFSISGTINYGQPACTLPNN